MILKQRQTLGVLAILAVLASYGTARAGAQDFQLYNRTGVDIYALYVSPTGVEDWQENVLGASVLLNGADITVTFPTTEEAELWDLRIEDQAGNSIDYYEINLFTALEVILQEDGNARIKSIE